MGDHADDLEWQELSRLIDPDEFDEDDEDLEFEFED